MLYVFLFTETTAEVLERYAAQQEKLGPVINPDSLSSTSAGGGDNLSTATTGADNSTTTSTSAATNTTTSAAEKPNVTSSAVGESADSKTAAKPVATTAAAV